MVDVLKLINPTPEELARIRQIQSGMDQNMVSRGRASAEALHCFMEKMKAKYPDVLKQWQDDMRKQQGSTETFFDRLPSNNERREGARLLSEQANDQQALMRDAKATSERLGIPADAAKGDAPYKLAVLDITENAGGCVVANNPAPSTTLASNTSVPPRRTPTMTM